MSTPIERLRYYDGEYLRSLDFEAEQNYHLQMRRRLNMGLHLPGIVEGLDIQSSTSSTVTSCWISPGMAVDALGREILVVARKAFDMDDDAFKSNRINPPADFSVWLRYLKSGSTPPSTGYSSCNQNGLNTRWQESFEVVLLLSGSPIEQVYNDAAKSTVLTGALSENAASDHVAVYLGTVHIDASQSFSIPSMKVQPPAKDGSVTELDGGRPYIGVRAQLVSPPVKASALNILALNTGQNPATSVEVDGSLFATQNLIVGGDFIVPPAGITPATSGNVKVTGDLYLNGTLYIHQGANWLSLDSYIASSISRFIPDVHTGTLPIIINQIAQGSTAPPAAAVDSTTFQVTSALLKNRTPTISAALAKVEFDTVTKVSDLLNNASVKTTGEVSVEVKANIGPSSIIGAPSNQYEVTLTWAIGPTLPDGGSPPKLLVPVKSMVISYVIVFYPDTSS